MNDASPPKIDDLLRLSGQLAEQVLRSRAAGQSISNGEAAALADAAAVLRNYERSLPCVLAEALQACDEDPIHSMVLSEPLVEPKAEVIEVPKTGALPQRVFSMLGFG